MLSQTCAPLVETLQDCACQQISAFYTPGHKGGQGISHLHQTVFGCDIFRVDVPELPGLDDLFAPESVIFKAQQLAAEAFGAEQTWFLVNGSTCGIEAALLATCAPGDKVVVPRNAHQSVLSGLILSGAIPIWVTPVYDQKWQLSLGVTVTEIDAALHKNPDAKAVLVVSPTYEGVCSDIAAISSTVHSYDVPLIVDAAHGPHLAFHAELPPSALSGGADIVVHSAHKVLSAFTQAALMHVQSGRCDRNRLNQALRITQSSSPSYLLLGSLDAARHQMANQGQSLMERTLDLARSARRQLSEKHLPVLDVSEIDLFQQDLTRLTVDVSVRDTTGFAADVWLYNQGVIAELPTLHQLTFIISLGNSRHDIERLVHALGRLPATGVVEQTQQFFEMPLACMSPRDAFFAAAKDVAIEHAIGRLSASTVCIYPPGIPQLMPGELITEDVLTILKLAKRAGAHLSGLTDPSLQKLRVIEAAT